jgi:hypothetical protein
MVLGTLALPFRQRRDLLLALGLHLRDLGPHGLCLLLLELAQREGQGGVHLAGRATGRGRPGVEPTGVGSAWRFAVK